jgi:hypothetical protein
MIPMERYMFVETVSGKPSRYAGCVAYMDRLHSESLEILPSFTDTDLQRMHDAR